MFAQLVRKREGVVVRLVGGRVWSCDGGGGWANWNKRLVKCGFFAEEEVETNGSKRMSAVYVLIGVVSIWFFFSIFICAICISHSIRRNTV